MTKACEKREQSNSSHQKSTNSKNHDKTTRLS